MQKIYTGSCDIIGEILCEIKTRKFLLVCGKSFDCSTVKDVIAELGIPYVRFSEFSPNPLYEDVVKGVSQFKKGQCDTIVAVGGGSAIDVAKCIKLYSKMVEDRCFLEQEYKDTHIPLVVIPTTAGTGSESTRFAVIYYRGNKQSVTHDSILPDYAVLDSSLLETLPVYQKKCSVMDALCQGIESWWSVNSTPESRALSEKSVRTILENIDGYIEKNDSYCAGNILTASNIAGQAINITQTTAAHAMSYKLTSMYSFPHGHAVAVCLPEVFRKMIENDAKCTDKRGREYLQEVLFNIADAFNCKSPSEAIIKFENLLARLELKKPSSASKGKDVELLTDSVNPIRLSNNPVMLDKVCLKYMYERIVKDEA